MPAAAMKCAISFGLVHMPVALTVATSASEISFNQLHKEDNARIRYKKVCEKCGEEVSSKDIVKAFQFAKDEYVIMNDEEVEALKTKKDKSLSILMFTDIGSIHPVYYKKAYFLAPQTGGEKSFELLRQAMILSGKAAVARTVIGSAETLAALYPAMDGILLQTMYYDEDIRQMPGSYLRSAAGGDELKMAKMLIDAMDKPFNPAEYHDTYNREAQTVH